MRVVSIGEVLWDVIDGRAFLGGAPLNVCANLQRCGDQAFLVSGVGSDARGAETIEAMHKLDLSTSLVQTVEGFPTGTAVVGRNLEGEPNFVIERPAAFDAFQLDSDGRNQILALSPDWIYMGTLLQTAPEMERLLRTIRTSAPRSRCFYDMNLRAGHWNLPLVERLCEGVSVLKLNDVEASTLSTLTGVQPESFTLESFCRDWSKRFGIDVICATLGPDGCCVFAGGAFEHYSGKQVKVSDTVGAGDAFAAAFLHGYHQGWSMTRCAQFANSLGAFVASQPGATPAWTLSELAFRP